MESPGDHIDRISNLTDLAFHHILSFLNMKEIAKLSLTSKKIREFCISIPVLILDGMAWKRDPVNRFMFANYVDRFFALRKGMEMVRLSIHWPLKNASCEEKNRVFTWLYNAVGCKLQWLDLDIILNREDVFSLPLSVFRCQSLKKFEVDLHGSILHEFPSSGGFYNLKFLTLTNLRINNDSFGEWISSHCKYLEDLVLEKVEGIKNIVINSSSLLNLTIATSSSSNLCNICISAVKLTHCILFWKCYHCKSLKIFAPNLIYLIWEGYLVDSYCLEKFKHMKATGLNIKHDSSLDRHEIFTRKNLSSLLNSICTTTRLCIDYECNQIIFKQGCLPAFFPNLSILYIYTNNLNDCLVPAIASLLKGTPNLKTLHIRYDDFFLADGVTKKRSKSYGFTIEYWESQNLALVRQLETAKIECFDEGDNELELIKYLLKHARALKMMTILYSALIPPSIIRDINDYGKASTAEIVFLPALGAIYKKDLR